MTTYCSTNDNHPHESVRIREDDLPRDHHQLVNYQRFSLDASNSTKETWKRERRTRVDKNQPVEQVKR